MKKNIQLNKAKKGSGRQKAIQKAPQKSHEINILLIAALAALTVIAYFPVFKAGFLVWNDPDYVINNIAVRRFDIHKLLLESVQGNYHPLHCVYYVSPIIVLLLILISIWSLRKTRVIVFGLAFHIINLLLVLQFYIVESAIRSVPSSRAFVTLDSEYKKNGDLGIDGQI